MREIKHRLRSPLDKIVGYEKWYPGSMDSKNFYVAEPCWLYSEDGEFWNPKKIDHRMKDAFTGLKDKNGREIYEGDILKSASGVQVVEWHFNRWLLKRNGRKEEFNRLDFQAGFFEVIGNIHDNPDLVTTLYKGEVRE